MPNQDERRVIKMLWPMVSKAAERSRRQRHDTFCYGRECTAGQFQWNDVYSRQTGKD